MAKLYEASDGERGCPGEEQCETFQSSSADSPVRCPSCPKRAGSEVRGQGSGEELETNSGALAAGCNNSKLETDPVVDVIERLVRERDSGFGYPDDLTELEKQLVLVWDDNVAAIERAHQIRTTMMLEAMMARA